MQHNGLRPVTADQIKAAREQAPFRAFTLHLSDQRQFPIRHPDFLWIVPGGRTVAVAHENGAVELIDLIHITRLKRTNNVSGS